MLKKINIFLIITLISSICLGLHLNKEKEISKNDIITLPEGTVIEIAGRSGVGKTTLAKELKKIFSIFIFKESDIPQNVTNLNNYVSYPYNNIKIYENFIKEIKFVNDYSISTRRTGFRAYYETGNVSEEKNQELSDYKYVGGVYNNIKIYENLTKQGISFVDDYSIFTRRPSYRAYYETGNVPDEEYQILLKMFDYIDNELRIPDVIVYLKADLPTIYLNKITKGKYNPKSHSEENLILWDKYINETMIRLANETLIIEWNYSGLSEEVPVHLVYKDPYYIAKVIKENLGKKGYIKLE